MTRRTEAAPEFVPQGLEERPPAIVELRRVMAEAVLQILEVGRVGAIEERCEREGFVRRLAGHEPREVLALARVRRAAAAG